MAEKSTFIKIDRNITEWGWYQDGNTFRVFIHLIIKASIKDREYVGIVLKRGEYITTYNRIATELKLSIQQARTALEHLKSTGEITITRHSKFQVISIKNYDFYQSNYENQQSNNNQITINQQSNNNQITIKQECKERKEEKECKETISGESPEPPACVPEKPKRKSKTKADFIPEWFEEVWKMYPRKEGKSAVTKDAFIRLSEAGKETIIKAIENYKRKIAENGTDKKYIKHGKTFFNGAWEDYVSIYDEEQADTQQQIIDSYQDDFYGNRENWKMEW